MAKWVMPHETSAEEVLPMAKKPIWVLPHEVEAEEAAKPTPAETVLAEETPVNRAVIGAGQKVSNVLAGAKQKAGMLRNLFPGEQSKWPQEVSEQLKNEAEVQAALNKDPYAGYGRLGTEVALGSLGPGRTVLGGALTGGVLEGLNPQEKPTLGDTLTDIGKGVLLGGAGAGVVNGALTTVAKLRNASKGRFSDPEAANRLRIFRQNDVPASIGDITQNPNILAVEDTLQHIPFSGRKNFLEGQSARLGEVVEGAPERIAGITPAQSKEDVGAVLAGSIKKRYADTKTEAGKLYDAVEARVQASGNPPVTPTNTANEVNALLGKYPSVFAKLSDDPETVKALETIASGVRPGKSPILGANGQPISTPPNLTFSEMRDLDSSLGAMIRQGRQLTARGDMNNKSFDQLVKIQKALRKDIEDWSTSVGDPEIASGVAEANKFFKEKVIPFRKNQMVRKVIQDENYNPDTLANTMFKLDSPYLSTQAKDFLTLEGIQAGRFHLLNQAKKRAMDDTLSSGYSPSKFLKGTELGESGPKLFTPDELSQLGDLQELIGASRRAAGYKFNPPTGASLWGAIAGKAPMVSAAARGLNNLSTSPAAMKFVLSNPNLYTGSGALGRIAEEGARKSGTGLGLDFKDVQ